MIVIGPKRSAGPEILREEVLPAARGVREGADGDGYGDGILFQLQGAKETIAIPESQCPRRWLLLTLAGSARGRAADFLAAESGLSRLITARQAPFKRDAEAGTRARRYLQALRPGCIASGAKETNPAPSAPQNVRISTPSSANASG